PFRSLAAAGTGIRTGCRHYSHRNIARLDGNWAAWGDRRDPDVFELLPRERYREVQHERGSREIFRRDQARCLRCTVNDKELKFPAAKPFLQPSREKPDANELAEQRTELALLRSFQATERTLMAWVRTAISMISFGFSMVKFFEYLEEDKHKQFHFFGPAGVGMILILIGILALIVAVVEHKREVYELCICGGSQRGSLFVLGVIFVSLVCGFCVVW